MNARGQPLPTAVSMLQQAGLRLGLIAGVDQGRGFRDLRAQRPAPGARIRSGMRPVDLALPVAAYPAQVLDRGRLTRVVVYGPGGRRVDLRPEELEAWRQDLRSVLATVGRRVRVGGPPLKGPCGVPLVHGETAVEMFFQPALRMELPEGILEVSSVLLPFVEYERGLLLLGAPHQQEAVTYSPLEQSLRNRAYLLTHDPPRE